MVSLEKSCVTEDDWDELIIWQLDRVDGSNFQLPPAKPALLNEPWRLPALSCARIRPTRTHVGNSNNSGITW